MVRLVSQINIKATDFALSLNFLSNFESKSSWDTLTDTAKVTIPKKIKFFKNKDIVATPESLFKRGNRITVNVGYYPNLKQVFQGYISDITNAMPFILHCQDPMWLLKQVEVKDMTLKGIGLKALLEKILPDQFKNKVVDVENEKYGYVAVDANLGDLVICNHATVANVLDKLRTEYTLFSFFRDGLLYVGLPNYPDLATEQLFHFEKNIVDNNLVYRRKDDVKIKLVIKHYTSDLKKNKQLSYGDSGGDTVEQVFFNVPLADIEKAANRRLLELKYEGFRGDFVAFGEPFVRHGDRAKMLSVLIPERNGTYLIKSVHREFGEMGYRQTIELENRLDVAK